jgi:hypothetical protein
MRVALGTFACSGIEAHLGADIQAGVRAALLHYAQKLKSGRRPLELPLFCRDQNPQDAKVAFDLTVDAETEAALTREAARQGATLSQLAVHTVMVYLAELDFLAVPPLGGPASRRKAL